MGELIKMMNFFYCQGDVSILILKAVLYLTVKAHSRPSQTFEMDLFMRIVKSFKCFDKMFNCLNVQMFECSNVQMFEGVLVMPLTCSITGNYLNVSQSIGK